MPPANPTNLSAVKLGSNSVRVSWTDSTGPDLLFTRVYRSSVNTFAETNFYLAVPGGMQSLDVQGLAANTPYYFWIKAEDDSAGLSGNVGSVSATTDPDGTYSVTPVKDFLALDVLKHLAAVISGFGIGTGTFPLFAGPPTASTSDAGFVTLLEDLPPNHSNPTCSSIVRVLCCSQDQAKAFGAAEAIRQYWHPQGDRVNISLPSNSPPGSGRVAMAARNAVKRFIEVDANDRFRVEVVFELQLQEDVN
jgi:hypothetical protein